MPGPDLLARIDRIAAELAELRAEVAATAGTIVPPVSSPDEADDMLDTHACSARFGFPRDTIAMWARQTAGTEQAIAVRSGGRWLINPRKLRQRINGG